MLLVVQVSNALIVVHFILVRLVRTNIRTCVIINQVCCFQPAALNCVFVCLLACDLLGCVPDVLVSKQPFIPMIIYSINERTESISFPRFF